MDKAEYFMMMPMYLSYCLCGEIANEYTEATTGGIINVETKTWDMDIIETLGYKKSLFGTLLTPSAKIGNFTDEMKAFAGFDAEVVCCASHDTGSAVAAVSPSDRCDVCFVRNLEPYWYRERCSCFNRGCKTCRLHQRRRRIIQVSFLEELYGNVVASEHPQKP